VVVEKIAKKFRSFAEAVTNVYGFWWSSSTMGLSKDWREFLELLNSRGVDYVIVGADRADPSIVRSVILNEVKDLTQVD
jgi:hypothetical protein